MTNRENAGALLHSHSSLAQMNRIPRRCLRLTCADVQATCLLKVRLGCRAQQVASRACRNLTCPQAPCGPTLPLEVAGLKAETPVPASQTKRAS